MIVPVIVTAIILLPFLLYIVFADQSLVPTEIEMHELSAEEKKKPPVDPNIPDGRGILEEQEKQYENAEQVKAISLGEIMHPFIDRKSAAFGAFIMSATLITLLTINASDQPNGKEKPVFFVTLPAAFVMFCWDLGSGWLKRKKTRETARKGREEKAQYREQQKQERLAALENELSSESLPQSQGSAKDGIQTGNDRLPESPAGLESSAVMQVPKVDHSQNGQSTTAMTARSGGDEEKQEEEPSREKSKGTLVSCTKALYRWSQETFPTVTTVLSHLPYALLPFAFSMFILVQGLASRGWVPVFAYGWDHVCVFLSFSSPV
jgi:hypothetical protein